MSEVIDFTTKAKKEEPEEEKSSADQALDGAKGKFPYVIVIGIDDEGDLSFLTNNPNYTFMQWALSKAAFELHVHERS